MLFRVLSLCLWDSFYSGTLCILASSPGFRNHCGNARPGLGSAWPSPEEDRTSLFVMPARRGGFLSESLVNISLSQRGPGSVLHSSLSQSQCPHSWGPLPAHHRAPSLPAPLSVGPHGRAIHRLSLLPQAYTLSWFEDDCAVKSDYVSTQRYKPLFFKSTDYVTPSNIKSTDTSLASDFNILYVTEFG